MEDAGRKLAELLRQGDSFTYQGFASKGQYGYPDALKPEWLTWVARVDGAISKVLGENSSAYELVRQAKAVQVLGNGPEKFEQARSALSAALAAALEILAEDAFGEASNAVTNAPKNFSRRIFVVHGHDDVAKTELEHLLGDFGLQPIVLHRQPDKGRTIIEKFEAYADVGFAFILMTPDEVAYRSKDAGLPEGERDSELRARPNVIFEFGYFVGRIGRSRTCCLLKGNVAKPSDLDGLVYKKFNSIEEVGLSILKELQGAGYDIKLSSMS